MNISDKQKANLSFLATKAMIDIRDNVSQSFTSTWDRIFGGRSDTHEIETGHIFDTEGKGVFRVVIIYGALPQSGHVSGVIQFWINFKGVRVNDPSDPDREHIGYGREDDHHYWLDNELFHFDVQPVMDRIELKASQGKHKARDVIMQEGLTYYAKRSGWFKADDYLARNVQRLWVAREMERFRTGTYQELNAAVMKGVRDLLDPEAEIIIGQQFAHASESDPFKIAYTPDDEYGIADRQVKMNTGKYFAQFTDDQQILQRLAEAHRLGRLPEPVEIEWIKNDGDGETKDRIYKAYAECRGYIGACMSHTTDNYYSQPYHPLDAYGPDIALAVIRDSDGDIKARAICNTADLKYARIYSDDDTAGHNEMVAALTEADYTQDYDALDGMRMYRHVIKGQFVMPYTDGSAYRIFDDGEYLWLSTNDSSFISPVTGDRLTMVGEDSQMTGGVAGRVATCYHCDGLIIDDEMVTDRHNREYHFNCADEALVYVDNRDQYAPFDECVFSEVEEVSYLRRDAAEITAGEYAGDWCHEANATILHNGEFAYSEDSELVRLHDGEYALLDDTVECDGLTRLESECEQDGDRWILSGAKLDGIYMPDIDKDEIRKYFFKALIRSGYQHAKILGISTDYQSGYIDFESLGYIATEGSPATEFSVSVPNKAWAHSYTYQPTTETE